MKGIFSITLAICSCIGTLAVNTNNNRAITSNHSYHVVYRAEMIVQQPDTAVPVRIQLEKTSFDDLVILFISDTARQTQDIGPIFSKDYGELMIFAQQNQLKPKKFLAWYHSVQPPWIMEIALETDKLPSTLNGRVKSRIEKGGEVLIAHMWGPYSELSQSYIQIDKWLKQNNRMARANPFEVYINDPSAVKDPSDIQTDIYQPLQ